MRNVGEVKELRLPLEAIGVNLDERALGVFINLLSWGSNMTVRGLFVNGHVLCMGDIADVCPNSTLIELEHSMSVLIKAGLVGKAGNVLFISLSLIHI